MHLLKEMLLEFELTYQGERLFGKSVLKSVIKSIAETTKCFVDLIRPSDYKF